MPIYNDHVTDVQRGEWCREATEYTIEDLSTFGDCACRSCFAVRRSVLARSDAGARAYAGSCLCDTCTRSQRARLTRLGPIARAFRVAQRQRNDSWADENGVIVGATYRLRSDHSHLSERGFGYVTVVDRCRDADGDVVDRYQVARRRIDGSPRLGEPLRAESLCENYDVTAPWRNDPRLVGDEWVRALCPWHFGDIVPPPVDNPTAVGYTGDMPATITQPRATADYAVAVAALDWSVAPSDRHRDAAFQRAAFLFREAGAPRRRSYADVAAQFGFVNTNAAKHACYYGARLVGGEMPQRLRRATAISLDVHLLNRRFGVELEYNGSYEAGPDRLARALRDAGVDAHHESYNHATPNGYWKCTTDATVSGGECVSPPLTGDAGWVDMRTAMRTITLVGGSVGRNCGTHVHHDLTDFDNATQMRNLITNLRLAQDAIMMYVNRQRWTGGWASKLNDYEWNELDSRAANGRLTPANSRSSERRESGCGVDRYRCFNFNSLLTYGTVEFRAHGGTLNAAKLRPWIAVGQAVVEFSRLGHTFVGVQSVESMLATLRDRGLLTAHMARRFADRCRSINPTEVATLSARAIAA